MPALADNKIYLSIDGIAVQAYFKNVTLTSSSATVETTRGAGTDHMQRAPGLKDTSISITIGYDTANIQTFIQKIAPGQQVMIEYGPEGAVTGKPRHVQTFVITDAAHTVEVSKADVVFELTGEAADAPIVDMYAGAVY